MANSVVVIDNKLRITPNTSSTEIIIVKKTLDALDSIVDVNILTETISAVYDTIELEDGVYSISFDKDSPTEIIAFIISNINKQRSLFEIDAIKTKDFIGQKDYRIYYDLISFCIRYDELSTAISSFNNSPIIPFTTIELIKYFDTIINYFKYDIN